MCCSEQYNELIHDCDACCGPAIWRQQNTYALRLWISQVGRFHSSLSTCTVSYLTAADTNVASTIWKGQRVSYTSSPVDCASGKLFLRQAISAQDTNRYSGRCNTLPVYL